MPKQSLDLTALKRNLGPREVPAGSYDANQPVSPEGSHDTIHDGMVDTKADGGRDVTTDPGNDAGRESGSGGRLGVVLKKREKRYTVPFTLRIEAAQNERLDSLVRWSGMSKNELITTIIDAALPQLEAQAKG